MKKYLFHVLTSLSLFLIVACDQEAELPSEKPDGDPMALSESISKTGFDLFEKKALEEDNVLLSPLSIHNALTMTANGIKSTTIEEVLEVLHLSDMGVEAANVSYSSLYSEISPTAQQTDLGIANGIFYDDTQYYPNDEFISSLQEFYDIDQAIMDFDDNSSVANINDWVNDRTETRIDQVIKEIEDNEIMFIINALYFVSNWEVGFDEGLTTQRVFKNQDGTEVMVPTMTSDDLRPHIRTDRFEALDMVCKSGEYAMSFIQPKDGSTDGFFQELSTEELHEWYHNEIVDRFSEGRVISYIPKFKLRTNLNLLDDLNELGRNEPFNRADLSKMGTSPLGKLYLSRVLHDAFISIDEKGVEGAAATTVGVAAESMPPIIDFNGPFMFVLRHVETRVPIFMGKIGQL